MSAHPTPDQSQTWLPEADWNLLFTPAHLDHFAPKRGETDDPVPCLEVHRWEQGRRTVVMMLLAIEGFNDWNTRMTAMREIGRRWGEEGWLVLALRFACAAWTREFTREEDAARQGRLLETYEDRRESMLVAGMTLTGRSALARAELLRDQTGRIRAVRPWEVWTPQTQPDVHVTLQILQAAWEGYAEGMLHRQEDHDA